LEDAKKLVPVRVKVKAAPPTDALLGEIAVSVGTALADPTTKSIELETWPSSFLTVIRTVPAAATSLARISACKDVVLATFVLRADPFHSSVLRDGRNGAGGRNPVPFTWSVNPPPPTTAAVGEIVVITGAGRDCATAVETNSVRMKIAREMRFIVASGASERGRSADH
jgi:hypothetical protein